CVTDLHYGKETASFNSEILAARMESLGDRVIKIRAQLSPTVEFDRLLIYLGGDLNDGDGIYAGQHHHQETTNVEEQARECAAMLEKFILRQREAWGRVDVVAVAGNHGRGGGIDGKALNEAANWDIVAYRYLALALKPHGIHLDLDNREVFRRVIQVRGHGLLLHHGHFVRGGIMPIPAIFRRLLLWATSEAIAPFDLAIVGHWHSAGYWVQNALRLLMSGTPVTDDRWARDKLGLDSASTWWLFGVSDSYCPSWMFPMELDDRKVRSGGASVPPTLAPPPPPPAPVPVVLGRDVVVPAGRRPQHTERACQQCSKPFSPASSTQRVCVTCRTVRCVGCGNDWAMRKFRANQKYCSPACFGRARTAGLV
ncbi:MAG: hypothetical protein NUW21_13935, partial [Elusimicrobia bacterium]|nr:hypothetical protein [Elusimicrobiota bacterium]